jgi:polyisoprenoid-binding protein YceI
MSTGISSRKHRWWRWILAGVVLLVVLAVAAAGLLIKLQPTRPPLALSGVGASRPAGPLDGTWHAAAGSVAGFRVRETALGFSNDVVGRTSAVSGTLTISGGRVTQATFRVDLTQIKVNGKTQPQFEKILGTQADPIATVTLSQPVTLDSVFASGAIISRTAAGLLTMHGASHPVTITLSGRRDGSSLRAAGDIPVQFATWAIKTPAGFGAFGSLARHGTAEFSVILDRAGF